MSDDQGPQVLNVQSAATTQDQQYNAPFSVSITFPESVVIKMVDATALNDYEVGLFFSSVFFSAFIGFMVATSQAPQADQGLYAVVTIIFGGCAGGFFIWAVSKRRKMTSRYGHSN